MSPDFSTRNMAFIILKVTRIVKEVSSIGTEMFCFNVFSPQALVLILRQRCAQIFKSSKETYSWVCCYTSYRL